MRLVEAGEICFLLIKHENPVDLKKFNRVLRGIRGFYLCKGDMIHAME